MFDGLGGKLTAIFDRLTKRGALNEGDVNTALREVRVALLEADVALPVVKDFIEKVRVRAVGHEVLKSITPGQQVVKIVHDALVETLGAEAEPYEQAKRIQVGKEKQRGVDEEVDPRVLAFEEAGSDTVENPRRQRVDG